MCKNHFKSLRFSIVKRKKKMEEDKVKRLYLLQLKIVILISIGHYMCCVIKHLKSSGVSMYHQGYH
jgi:hypothetical protein